MEGLRSNLKISLWDFAGQDVYYATHGFFLTEDCLPVILMDMRKGIGGDENRLLFWLHSIQSRIGKSKVMIVGSFLDEFIEEKGKRAVREKNEEIEKAIEAWRTSMKDEAKLEIVKKGELSFWPINALDPESTLDVKRKIIDLSSMALGHPCDKNILTLMEILKTENERKKALDEDPIYRKEDIKGMIRKAFNIGQPKEELVSLSLKVLHRFGILMDFSERVKEFEDKIIGSPQWLADLFKSIFSIHTEEFIQSKGGVLEKADFSKRKKGPFSTTELVELLESFNLITRYKEGKDKYVVPAFLKERIEWTRFMKEHEISEILGVSHTLNFLPPGLFHQMCVHVARSVLPSERARGWIPSFFNNGVSFHLEGCMVILKLEDQPIPSEMKSSLTSHSLLFLRSPFFPYPPFFFSLTGDPLASTIMIGVSDLSGGELLLKVHLQVMDFFRHSPFVFSSNQIVMYHFKKKDMKEIAHISKDYCMEQLEREKDSKKQQQRIFSDDHKFSLPSEILFNLLQQIDQHKATIQNKIEEHKTENHSEKEVLESVKLLVKLALDSQAKIASIERKSFNILTELQQSSDLLEQSFKEEINHMAVKISSLSFLRNP
jgi:hypothetical protein